MVKSLVATFATVFFDVEDPFNPLATDALMDLLLLLEATGTRAEICITGEKCRQLMAESRTEILDKLKHQSLGFHTNTHSLHPTTMELLEYKSWADGVEAIFETEKPGVDAFVRALGRLPDCWGGAGNGWGPQVAGALPLLGIPAYVYAHTATIRFEPHLFCGVMAFPSAVGIEDSRWAERSCPIDALLRVDKELERDPAWIGIFCGHPSRLRHKDYWDFQYYRGRTPETYVPVEPVDYRTYRTSLKNLGTFLVALQERVSLIGIGEALAFPWRFRELSYLEMAMARRRTASNIAGSGKWQVVKEGLDTSLISALTLERLDTLRVAEL